MDQKQIDRINELAKKAKSPEGLTEWEEMERAASLSVPLIAEAHSGKNWLAAKE